MRKGLERAWKAVPFYVRTPVEITWRSIQLYNEDRCGTFAAAIAYYAIFSIVPLALITLSVLGLVIDSDRIVQFVFDQIPLREDPDVESSVNSIVSRSQSISAAGLGFGFIALIWSSSGIFAAVRRGLNAAAHKERPRPFWRGKLLDFALIPSIGLLILVSIGLTTAMQVVVERGAVGPLKPYQNIPTIFGSYLLPALASFSMFALLYRYVPSVRPRWAQALVGATMATLLFEITKNVYAIVVARMAFEQDTAIYTGFGTAMGFLFWMFLSASILMLGAEFGRAVFLHLHERDEERVREAEARRAAQAGSGAHRIGSADRGHRGL